MSDKMIANAENATVSEMSITTMLNTRYKQYALYLIYNRAIPALSDGLKIVQRKALHTAINNLKGSKKSMKVAAVTGYLLAESKYHHGDGPGSEAITMMAQDHKMALPYFDGIGDFGSLYTPVAGAARYVEIALSKNYDLLFKDNNLLQHIIEEGDSIEPYTFYPIIPTILINSTMGIAIGYQSSITNKNPIQVIDAVLEYLETDELPESLQLQPYFNGAVGRLVNYNGRFEHHGFMSVVNSTTVEITGLPYDNTYESYEAHLNDLVNEGYAKEWFNEGENDSIQYVVKFTREQLAEHQKKDTLYHKLKMYSRIPKDNLTVLDVDGTIKRFDNESELIKRFVDWRKTIYELRKTTIINDLNKSYNDTSLRLRFVELVNAGTIDVKNITSRKDGEQLLASFDLPSHLLDIKLYSISVDEIQRLKDKLKALAADIEFYKNVESRTMYIDEVKSLRKSLIDNGYSIGKVDYITAE
jgi:DNA gyrase/topoisomerase IV subunit A